MMNAKLEAQWIVGFTDGEGCFHVGISKNPRVTLGYQVLPEFTVVQHQRDIKILYALKDYFQCGVVRKNHGERWCYRVRARKHLQTIILPFFERHPLKTMKHIDMQKMRRVVLLMDQSAHLNPEGLERIREIQQTMNRGRLKQTRGNTSRN